MAKYSEVEKITLKNAFKNMLEEGMEYCVADTIELFGLGEGVPIAQRKRFFISIREDKNASGRL